MQPLTDRRRWSLAAHQLALVGCLGGVLTLGLVSWQHYAHLGKSGETKLGVSVPLATSLRRGADRKMTRGDLAGARADLMHVVSRFRGSSSKLEQDEVTASRIRLGFVSAKEADFDEAADWFEQAEAMHQGGDTADPDFGTLPDQAAYQASVCRAKNLPPGQASKTYLEFARSHPRSPLVYAAFKRIQRLQDPPEAMVRQFDAIAKEQDEWIRRETALCGPKALARVLEVFELEPPPLERLAALCNTTNQGTTLSAMREALKHLGLRAVGMRVNSLDFAKLPRGALWLKDGHFLVFEAAKEDRFLVFDPIAGKVQERPLPDDVQFTADVLVVRRSQRNQS